MKAFSFLERYGLLESDSLAGDYLKVKCIFHNENTPSLFFDLGKDRFYCYGCSRAGDLFEAIKYIEGCSGFQALKILASLENMEYVPAFSVDSNEREDEKYSIEYSNNLIGKLNRPSGKRLEYLKNRGIKDSTIEKFNILENLKDEYQIVLPILANGEIKGICKRVLKDIKPKYRYNKGFRRRQNLFLLVENKNLPVFLTEGLIDAYSAYQMGYPNVAALFGGVPSKYQLNILDNYDIICGTDSNEVGERGYEILKEKLKRKVFRFDFSGFIDTNDMLVKAERKFICRMHKLIRR